MTETQIAKVRNFLGDKTLQGTIKELLRYSFLAKKDGADVQILAAQTLAFQLLDEAWRDMERYKAEPKNTDRQTQSHV